MSTTVAEPGEAETLTRHASDLFAERIADKLDHHPSVDLHGDASPGLDGGIVVLSIELDL